MLLRVKSSNVDDGETRYPRALKMVDNGKNVILNEISECKK